ncbi:MAG TPA: hypothetical protein VI362_07465 [Ignavibacteriaceae bacterium]|nr:hypothetical protein [Ignavibacteriaceae bacterium]
MDLNNFPRQLTVAEKNILFSILPESKYGYKMYRQKINNLLVIGSGRFGGNNYFLGSREAEPDLSIPSSPVFALGIVVSGSDNIDVIVHEEQEEQIEFDITSKSILSFENDLTVDKVKCYSNWNPGEKYLFGNAEVREYVITPGAYILAVAPELKKIWLHENSTSVNHIIPVTNFFNELMRLKNIRDPKLALSPGIFFENINEYKNDEIRNAFLMYDKYLSKFNIKDEKTESLNLRKSNKKLLKIFKRGQV